MSQKISENIEEKINESIDLARISLKSGEIANAIELLAEARDLAKEYKKPLLLAKSYIQLASCHQKRMDYVKVMNYSTQALTIYKKELDVEGQATCLNSLGSVYNYLQDYKKRLECNLKCLELRQLTDDEDGIITTYNNIGDTYLVLGQYKNALVYFNYCLTYDLDDHMKAIVYYNMAETFHRMEDASSSSNHLEEALVCAKSSEYWDIIIAVYSLRSEIFLAEKEHFKAIKELKQAIKLADQKGTIEDLYPLYKILSEAYFSLEDYKRAYSCLNMSNELKKEVQRLNNTQDLKRIEFEFQTKSLNDEKQEMKEKNQQLMLAFNKIEDQRNEIEQKNVSILDSILYARRIQTSLLPSEEKLLDVLNSGFVFYKPKDIVSGDFYWVEQVGDINYFAVIDCTGHGVPGAFVSLIAFNMINKVVLENKISKPAEILKAIDELVTDLFSRSEEKVRDGMDIGLCAYNTKSGKIEFAGAYHSLLYISKDGELGELRGNRESIGYSIFEHKKAFVHHELTIEEGMQIYMTSDGFPDQFGGEKGKKLKWKGFKTMIDQISKKPIDCQRKELSSSFDEWRNGHQQIDDICVMGIKF